MSYCVNCGVELAESEKSCPLCTVEVINPVSSHKCDSETPYPPYRQQSVQKVSREGIIDLLTIIFLIPVAISVVCDLSLTGTLTWAGYVIGAFSVLYIFIVLPMVFDRMTPPAALALDAAGLLAFLLFIERINRDGWFLFFAMPVTLILFGIIITVTALSLYTKIQRLIIAALTLILIGFFCVTVEMLLNLTFNLRDHLIWSIYPAVTFAMLSIAVLYINGNKPLKEKLERKLFI